MLTLAIDGPVYVATLSFRWFILTRLIFPLELKQSLLVGLAMSVIIRFGPEGGALRLVLYLWVSC